MVSRFGFLVNRFRSFLPLLCLSIASPTSFSWFSILIGRINSNIEGVEDEAKSGIFGVRLVVAFGFVFRGLRGGEEQLEGDIPRLVEGRT